MVVGQFAPVAASLPRLLALKPGMEVLDVGCGTGDDAREMAATVGGNGRVVGIDLSDTVITESKSRIVSNDLFPLMSLPGGYVNLLDEAEQKRLLLAFARNYERLLALKRTYDPDDVFHSTIGHITPTEKDSISLFQPAREMGQVIK